MTSEKRLTTMGLITVPALITLAITLVRLAGERQGWSRLWFNPDPGGGFALIGIVWLVPIFGVFCDEACRCGRRTCATAAFLAYLAQHRGDCRRVCARDKSVAAGSASCAGDCRHRFDNSAGHTASRMALTIESAGCVRLCRADSGDDHYVLCDSRELGHALRRAASGFPGGYELVSKVHSDWRDSAVAHVDRVHLDRWHVVWRHCGCRSET